MRRTIETQTDLAEGLAHLATCHPRFGEIAERLGPPALRRAPPGLEGLLRIITDQMISLQATWLRLGLSRAKARSFKALAQAVDTGAVPLDRFPAMSDAEIAQSLIAVPGLGRWTVEIYLLSYLGRSDVWPAGDLALQIAAHDAFGLEARPNEARMRALSEPWQPWRAVAARLLWAHYRSLRNMPQASD